MANLSKAGKRAAFALCALALLGFPSRAQEKAAGGNEQTVPKAERRAGAKTNRRAAVNANQPNQGQAGVQAVEGEVGARAAKKGSAVAPTFADVAYGPYKETVLDLWQAKSDKPAPLLVFIHGGGFRGGSKSQYNPILFQESLAAGISFAAVEYRLSGVATYPAEMHDCARAVQFLRSKAKEWNLDPSRIACTGGSAGAGISVWLAFHDDLANPKSEDPVERESTRITCALVTALQCTYDPREIRKIVPGNAYDVAPIKQLFGLPVTWNWDTDKVDAALDAKLKDGSPITHLTKDDAPVFVLHNQAANVDGNIHHANFGKHLKAEMDKIGVECVQRMDSDYPNIQAANKDMAEWMKKHFGMK